MQNKNTETEKLSLENWINFHKTNSNYVSSGVELSYAWDYGIEEKFYNLCFNREKTHLQKFQDVTSTGAISASSLNKEQLKHSIEWWEKTLADKDKNFFQKEILDDIKSISDDQKIDFRDKKVSYDWFRFQSYLYEINKNTDINVNDKFNALEFGSGNGHFAASFKKRYPKSTYIMVDIPIIMYFASCNLINEFPEAKFLYVYNADDFNKSNINDFDFIFLPSYLIRTVNPIKIKLNLSSHCLGEMTNLTLKNFFSYIDECKTEYIFSVNRFLHNPINSLIFKMFLSYRVNENNGSLSFPSNYQTICFKHKPWFLQNPFVDSEHPQYLFVILERQEGFQELEKNKKTYETYMNQLTSQEWFTKYGKASIGCSLNIDPHIINNEKSDLRYLFDFFRLKAYEDDINFLEVFAKYIRHYCQGYKPEEYYFFQSLQKKIHNAKIVDKYIINKTNYYYIFIRSGLINKLRKIYYKFFKKYKTNL